MVDFFTISKQLENGYELGYKQETIQTGSSTIDNYVIPYIASPKAWEQYNNSILYDAEVRLRNWMTEMCEVPKWSKVRSKRTYMFSQIFEFLFGRKYDQKTDAKTVAPLTKLFSYYSSKVSNQYYDMETQKSKSKTAYTLAPARLKKPPYSLKLRLEWLQSQGVLPDQYNMRLPKDNLTPGHARNPKTEANMERRREEGRMRYNEYQRDRRKRISEEGE